MIALDFDGTVADTIPSLTKAAVEVIARRYGLSPDVSAPLYRATLGVSFLAQLSELFPDHPFVNIEAAREFERAKDKFVPAAELFPGALELLESGLAVIVSSSRTRPIAEFLRRHYLALAQVFGARDMHENSKAEQLRQLGPRLFVGDAPRDAVCAAQAGVPFLAVEHTFSRAVFEELGLASVKSLLQVPRR